jgi:hypothetical protein
MPPPLVPLLPPLVPPVRGVGDVVRTLSAACRVGDTRALRLATEEVPPEAGHARYIARRWRRRRWWWWRRGALTQGDRVRVSDAQSGNCAVRRRRRAAPRRRARRVCVRKRPRRGVHAQGRECCGAGEEEAAGAQGVGRMSRAMTWRKKQHAR